VSDDTSEQGVTCLGDMWALNMASFTWSQVDMNARVASPSARAFSAMVSFDRQAGLKSPIALIGGASMDCYGNGCEFPLPLDDVWILDTATAESGGGLDDDNMAEFDGEDFIVVDLPSWCSDVASMSVLWIDAWINAVGYTVPGADPIVLFDTYYGDSSVLRWCFEGSGETSSGESSSYVTLFLTTSQV
jgi:hypothetical protein